jgi:hypothetical protein
MVANTPHTRLKAVSFYHQRSLSKVLLVGFASFEQAAG